MLWAFTLQWVVFGYSLSFSPWNRFIGGLTWLGLQGVGSAPYEAYAPGIPHEAFMIFQAMFAIITPALIIGAFAERMRFAAFVDLHHSLGDLCLRSRLPLGVGRWRMAEGDGGPRFRGGAVVHINAGVAALVAALVIGKRNGYNNRPVPPAQPALYRARHRAALVRVVRL